ncbi:unnamed protein product [Trypanosoma congolense IL3000]|uniref:WGS project CAEQ00000000 data, annotated contig 1907 n=1 Tax=Trypanosoma congolense (strain IL3000) TaxID=1068625 RepID=F9W9X0_TRYCI|nr:unnamed protein product [Trypanosoma congolense IL3000]
MQVSSAVRQRENREKATAVFIDYERAFNSVDHGCVIEVLKAFGVEVHFVARIVRLLQGRTAQVRVSSIKSDDTQITCGVPQGSVLGPLLLLITVVESPSRLLNEIQGFMHGFFGDDLTIICTHAKICRRFRKRRRRAWIASPVGQRSSLWRPQQRGRCTRCLDPATKIC